MGRKWRTRKDVLDQRPAELGFGYGFVGGWRDYWRPSCEEGADVGWHDGEVSEGCFGGSELIKEARKC